jgi:hypothetical protein
MGLTTVTAVADARRRTTKDDPRFCPTCTGYVGAAGSRDGVHQLTQTACPGSPEAHVAATHPTAMLIQDHLDEEAPGG